MPDAPKSENTPKAEDSKVADLKLMATRLEESIKQREAHYATLSAREKNPAPGEADYSKAIEQEKASLAAIKERIKAVSKS